MLGCSTSKEAKPLETIIGQDRAIRALQFGLEIKEFGFNIFVSGLPGTGRMSAVKRYLEMVAQESPVPCDWCYVTNFKDSYRPNVLSLPPGLAVEFQRDMRELVEEIQRRIPKAFESEEYASKQEELSKALKQKSEQAFNLISEDAQKRGFLLQATPVGLMILPQKDGAPLQDAEFTSLPPEEKEAITRERDKLQDQVKAVLRQMGNLERTAHEEFHKLERETARQAIEPLTGELKEKYSRIPDVISYLEEVRDDLLKDLSFFRPSTSQQPHPHPQLAQAAAPPQIQETKEQQLRKYDVNILVENSRTKGAPVVMELNPTYNELFGRIEKEAHFGGLITDFTMIKEGALHRANGGYLVLPAEEVLRNLFSWESLKRALRNREINIEEAGERLGFVTMKSLKPQPIPVNVKIVLIGRSWLYHLLYAYDEDFRELFKVKADFDTQMDRTEKNVRDYTSFVCAVCEEEGLKHLDGSGLAKVVEYGCRLAEDQEKLSTRFSEITDLIKEANHYSKRDDSPFVTGSHVRQAVEEKIYRSNLIQKRIEDYIHKGILMIDVKGEKIGTVNGLSVMDVGDIAIGRPNRITATIGLGREGLIDIEREAKLGGPIHTKGVMILSGFLAERYAYDKPLNLSARLVFEQSYSGVEGDSASSAELYAILSSLSGIPIKQSMAVTGSVNQKGEVQAIGGVNEKIEGFFNICKIKGWTGEQGVIIPESNVKNLMLKEEVVEAVHDKRFHVWPVRTIDEGIEILTGMAAGAKRNDRFEEGTINSLADEQLRKFSKTLKEFQAGEEREKERDEG
jgi:lon-related putative ATP-dependent protease